jgi:hypothetical protein
LHRYIGIVLLASPHCVVLLPHCGLLFGASPPKKKGRKKTYDSQPGNMSNSWFLCFVNAGLSFTTLRKHEKTVELP